LGRYYRHEIFCSVEQITQSALLFGKSIYRTAKEKAGIKNFERKAKI